MPFSLSRRGLLGCSSILPSPVSSTVQTTMSIARSFSTTTSLFKKKPKDAPAKPKAGRRKNTAPRSEFYGRVKVLKQNLFSPAPPPLRMGRLRHLRHWTVHRAWQLFRRQQREASEKERARMQAGMYNACEELRKTAGPGDRDEGYLYRVAMEKKGVWGTSGVPIEYARFQTEYPGRTPWNHDWKR